MDKPTIFDNAWSRATVRKAVRSPGAADAPAVPVPVKKEFSLEDTFKVTVYRDFGEYSTACRTQPPGSMNIVAKNKTARGFGTTPWDTAENCAKLLGMHQVQHQESS